MLNSQSGQSVGEARFSRDESLKQKKNTIKEKKNKIKKRKRRRVELSFIKLELKESKRKKVTNPGEMKMIHWRGIYTSQRIVYQAG